MLSRALGDATRVYRVRYLSEKYELSFDEWVEQTMANDAAESSDDEDSDEEPIDVEAEVQAAILAADHDHSDELPKPRSDGAERLAPADNLVPDAPF
jgi:hypothetical protein